MKYELEKIAEIPSTTRNTAGSQIFDEFVESGNKAVFVKGSEKHLVTTSLIHVIKRRGLEGKYWAVTRTVNGSKGTYLYKK